MLEIWAQEMMLKSSGQRNPNRGGFALSSGLRSGLNYAGASDDPLAVSRKWVCNSGSESLRRGAIGEGRDAGLLEAGAGTLMRGAAGSTSGQPRGDLRLALERDGLVVLETRPFQLTDDDVRLVQFRWSDGRSKNSSYNPPTGAVYGVGDTAQSTPGLERLMARYSAWAIELIETHFPAYAESLELGRTSLRHRSVRDDPPLSLRKDDRSLHLDAFTSQPVAGRRILRLFCNIDPSGSDREWAIADGGFEDFALRFRSKARRLYPGEAAVLHGLSLTKCRRTDYDQIMLGMHDAAKRDRDYQSQAPRHYVSFPQGTTWLAFTDQTPHAAVSGHCALEQTFYVPVESLADPVSSPLRILERLWGGPLV